MILFKTLKFAISDILVMTWRNAMRYTRLPQLLVFSTIQPVMFLILFVYVFGGAINTPGVNYVNYLIPGILVQTVIFGAIQTGVGLADDLSKGMIDRFNSLPISRAAVLAGRTIADTLRNIFVVTLMVGVGLIIGFEFQEGFSKALVALVLIVSFGFAFSWIAATIGLLIKEAETAQVAGFIWVFPLVFASSIFVPVETMPDWLRKFAENSPITLTVNAVRALMVGGDVSLSLWKSALWIMLIIFSFFPISVLIYKKKA